MIRCTSSCMHESSLYKYFERILFAEIKIDKGDNFKVLRYLLHKKIDKRDYQ